MPDTRPIAPGVGSPGEPLVHFYRMIEQARPPLRADKSAAGSLPTRAFRYCDAITTASAWGWYLFPPMDFSLSFDGNEVFASYTQADGTETGWFPLSVIQFPDFPNAFDAAAPEGIKGFAPPFLGCMQEPGIVQIWSGLIIRTAPGWSSLVRPPANFPPGRGFEVYEGIVETDHWFGPLFTNLRLTRTNSAVEFRRDWPVAMLQAIPQAAYAEGAMASTAITESLAAMRPEDWQLYADTVVRRVTQPVRKPGAYAVENRKRRRAGEAGMMPLAGADSDA